MAKSKIARQSKSVNHVRNSHNIVPLNLMIPYKDTKSGKPKLFDVSHLLHLGGNKESAKIDNRATHIRRYCKKANHYVSNGNSVPTVTASYVNLSAYLAFCDAITIDPFTESGYLKFAGNDGELRHRIKMFSPSKRLWEYNHGDELGIQESTCPTMLSSLRMALNWCGLPVADWALLHRGFAGERTPTKGYSEEEEPLLVTRLEDLFFTLAPQLITAKENNIPLPEALPIVISLGEQEEIIRIETSLDSRQGLRGKDGTNVNAGAAFNLTMGAAYHLMCYFTSLNDRNIRDIAHPIKIHTEERDKSLQVVKVSSHKPRANKEVDALLVGEQLDVDKRDGVKFIWLLGRLSKLYGNSDDGTKLIFTLNSNAEVNHTFNLNEINKRLVNQLHLLSPLRAGSLPWFKELFYTYRNQQAITLKTVVNNLGRSVVHKEVQAIPKPNAGRGATNSAYCIVSCYTDLPLKGILLPLKYSKRDSDGNVTVSFNYRNGMSSPFKVPVSDLVLIKDIEQYSTEKADKQPKKYERLLFTRSNRNVPNDWEGVSPISSSLMAKWSVEPNHYYLSLQSSRWREMTSNQAYAEGGVQKTQSILQSTKETLDKCYQNGDSLVNKVIISQSMEVVENLDGETSLKQAKDMVVKRRGIPMLSHDEGKKMREEVNAKTNPNGLICNGKQVISEGKNTQQKTNYSLRADLPCAEFDMCYKCQSAKAINDVEAIYKLMSFIDVLKEALDMYPDSTGELHEKIEQFEYTLDGASDDVFDRAMNKFNTQGRHPRVSVDHAILSL